MSESVSSDPAGQSADDVLKTSKHHDDLRTRIAAVLYEDGQRPMNIAIRLADAVIAELGLEPQAHYDPDCEFYRYVTDWIDPQTNRRVDLP